MCQAHFLFACSIGITDSIPRGAVLMFITGGKSVRSNGDRLGLMGYRLLFILWLQMVVSILVIFPCSFNCNFRH